MRMEKYIEKCEVNPERTAQARQLAEDLEQEFEDWIYQDYERKKGFGRDLQS